MFSHLSKKLYIKGYNKLTILDLIRFSPGGISRAELARKMGITRSAVTTIISDLISVGAVREGDNGQTTKGRRPVLLEISPNNGYVMGVDIGATHLTIVLSDLSARVIDEINRPFDIENGPVDCLEEVDTYLRKLLQESSISIENILAIGVGIPGPVEIEKGSVSASPIMPGWDDFPITSHLCSLWGCPIQLNNDAELGALGEWAYGAGRGEQNLVYIKVGMGIGAGLLLDGRLYRGATGAAGEIGHITILDNGPLCTCGNRGCLEAISCGRAIAEQARQAVINGNRTHLSDISPGDKITARTVAEAAQRGDHVSQQIVSNAGIHIGIALASLVNLYNPSVVVIGGTVSKMGDLLLEPIRRTVEKRGLLAAVQAVRIVTSVLGRRSTSMGAVVEAISRALEIMILGNPPPVNIKKESQRVQRGIAL